MSAGRENNCEQLRAEPLLCAWSRNRCCCQCIVVVHTQSHDSCPCFGLLNGFRWQHGAVHVTGVSLAGWWQVLITWSKPYRQCVDTGQIRDSWNDETHELYYLTWPGKSTFVYLFFLTTNLLKVEQFDNIEHENSTLLYCWKTQIPKVPSHLSLVTVWDQFGIPLFF